MSRKNPLATKKEIFISHGKDPKPVEELKAILADVGLKPVVLSEQPSGGRTIVEKLEQYSNVGFAFVILTPDDLGGVVEFGSVWSRPARLRRFLKNAHTRPRQNVVLEFGYFVGKLGRSRIACLLKKPVELPSDMQGIVYLRFNESIEEIRGEIVRELEAAGYEIVNDAPRKLRISEHSHREEENGTD
ncbi:MAG: TIR domain-containing protein [Candidatus Bathyarchaeia archaeon]